MTRGKKRSSAAFDPDEFPTLKEFFSGYLHEDFVDEYGSAAGAVRAFCGDASPDEAAQASEEWKKLREILAGRPIPELQGALQKLGGAWRPADLEEFQAVDAVLKGKAPERQR
jgi:CdiI immunity protein